MIVKLQKKSRQILLIALALLIGFGVFSFTRGGVRADQFDQQISELQAQNNNKQDAIGQLQDQASSYQDVINKLRVRINSLQTSIDENQAKQAELKQQIAVAQAQLDEQKKFLGESIRAMYVQGQISTLEMLASSDNINDFVDKQVYQGAVQDNIKETLDKITALKLKLQDKKNQIDALLLDLHSQQDDLSQAKAKQDQLLNFNEDQQAAFNHQISSNQSKIAELRIQQLAANQALGGSITFSSSCGGGYPASASGPSGHWGCNYAKDNTWDNWGMGNRECVSYTAWKVYVTYGHMPTWGYSGVGNANQWPGDARAYNIPTGSTPRVHSVAISMGGAFGHAMWVEAVSGNNIYVSQYNYDLTGHYSEMWVNGSSFTYIYFH